MKSPLYLFLMILSLNVVSVSAQDSSRTLLWRISGKHGEKPSYLYGTMHLSDQRVFNLGDSLYGAIKQADGFAMELDPADLSAFVLEEVKKEIIEAKNIRDLLSDKDYKILAPKLAKKLKKSPDDINTRDILREKNKWMQESFKTGKMKTFLDVYLYDIARRQGKWTGGIEDMDDQRGLVKDVVDKSDIDDVLAEDSTSIARGAETLIDVYLRQDLEELNKLTNGNETDPIMLRRNKKMSERIDSLSAVRSMVFAVGAAHLPGEQGLIKLLRKKGFRVDPVFSDKRIRAANYKVQEVPIAWEPVTDEGGLYEASMPGKPGNIQLYGVLNMKMYIDFFSSSGYFTTAVKSAMNIHGTDSVMEKAAKELFHSKKGETYTPITVNGAKGRMYSLYDDGTYRKGMILLKEGTIYIAMATSMKADSEQLKVIDRFLAGYKVLDISQKDAAFTVFSDSMLAFKIEVPGHPQLYKDMPTTKDNEGWDSKMYISVDNQEGAYYFFGVNSVQRGRFIENDSTVLDLLKKNGLAKLSIVSLDTSYFSDGHRIAEFRGKMKMADAWTTTRFIARGNRWYGLVVIYPSQDPSARVSRFLQSFTLQDYMQQNWQNSQSPDSVITTWTPSSLIKERDSSSDALVDFSYNSFDSSCSNSYSVVVSHLSPYYWSLSDSAFWTEQVTRHILRTDSLVYKKPISNGDVKGWEWMKVKKRSKMYERQRILLNGDKIYSLFVCTPIDQINSPNTNRYFEDFRFQRPGAKTSYYTSKAEFLLETIFNGDSTHTTQAFGYLDDAPFEKSNADLLYRYFYKKPLWEDSWINPSRVNNAITAKIISLKDTGSFSFAVENYRKVSDSLGDIKNNLLQIMAAFRDSVHFTQTAELLVMSPPHALLSYSLLNCFKDTMDLTAKVMPKLLSLLKDSLVCPSIINLSAKLLDSNRIPIQEVLPYETQLVHYGRLRAKAVSRDDVSDYNDMALVNLLGRINSPKTNAVLRGFLLAKDHYLRIKAIASLLMNKQAIDPAVYPPLAKDRTSRLALYTALEKAGKTSLFPVAFRTQKAFAESQIYEDVSEDEEPVSFIYVAMKPAVLHGMKKRYYFYKFKTEQDGSYYLACAGPFDADPLKLDPSGSSAVINYDEPFSDAHSEDQMNKLIRRLE